MNFTVGYLEIILGPMFSGKTTELIRIRNRYKHSNIKCCIINHSFHAFNFFQRKSSMLRDTVGVPQQIS